MKSEPCHSPPASVTYGQRQEPRKNDIPSPSESDGCEPKTKKKCLDLWPVMPSSSGQGLPYAPIDWPRPGDTWRWRVGNRISHTGFFYDRYLYPPADPQNYGCPKLVFKGRTPLEQYIRTEFPDADIDAFFASFSWKVPAIKRDWSSVTYGQRQEPRKNDIPSESDGCEPKTKKKCLDLWPVMPSSSGQGLPYAPIDWPRPGDTWRWRVGNRISHTGFFCDRYLYPPADPQNSGCPTLVFGGRAPLEQYIRTEFPDADIDAFFASFSWKVPAVKRDWSVSTAPLPRRRGEKDEEKEDITNDLTEDEMVEARIKLSFLLAMDFPLLISTDNLNKLTNLLSTLQKDSRLTLDQRLKLQTIEEIPLNAKHFLEAQKYIEDVDDFSADLDTNIAKVISSNKKYNQSKLKTAQLQAEIDLNLSAIQEIDDRIAQLQSRYAELAADVELKKVEKNEFNSVQTKVIDSLSRQKVESLKSKKQEWELKKAHAAKRVAEILAKYESLKGISL